MYLAHQYIHPKFEHFLPIIRRYMPYFANFILFYVNKWRHTVPIEICIRQKPEYLENEIGY